LRLVALELVRFFAAFAVVMYHYTARHDSNSFPVLSELTKFGYLGVPLFFIISGYVISLSANNRSPVEFAVSRFVRLYPAYWAGILITCAITICVSSYSYSYSEILANMTMLNDYFGFKNIDGVYWTLQAELKFYGCVFILLLFRVFSKFRYWLSIWTAFTVMHLITDQPFFMGWFISPSYSSFFIAGVAFYLVQRNGSDRFAHSVLLISLIVSSFHGFNQADGFIKNPGTLDQLIAVLILWLFYLIFFLLVTKRIELENKNVYLMLGALTYPLYLIHNVAGNAIINQFKGSYHEVIIVVSVILFVLLLSCLVNISFEKRISTPLKATLLSILGTISFLPKKCRKLK
jgi:peptidoglycan/LPS O-acetylase OafA/YrhL